MNALDLAAALVCLAAAFGVVNHFLLKLPSAIGMVIIEAETQLTFGIGGRLGAVLADRYLLYARAGYQRTNAELSVSGFGSEDEWFDGFRFGGGLEGFITDNFALRAEYTYTIYNDPTDIAGVDLDVNQHLARVGAAFYF